MIFQVAVRWKKLFVKIVSSEIKWEHWINVSDCFTDELVNFVLNFGLLEMWWVDEFKVLNLIFFFLANKSGYKKVDTILS